MLKQQKISRQSKTAYFLYFLVYFPRFTSSKEITSRITNSHKFVGVVDAGGEPGLELFLRGHLYHLILLRSVPHAVSVLAGTSRTWQRTIRTVLPLAQRQS